MSGDPDAPTDPDQIATGGSTWTKWAVVVIVGDICFVLAAFLLGAVRVDSPLAYVGAFVLATFIGGRVGGVRGVGQWVLAAVLVFAVAIVLLYLAILAIASTITGP